MTRMIVHNCIHLVMKMSQTKDTKSLIILILYAVALAMGVFGIVILTIAPTTTAEPIQGLYGIAIFCLALAGILSKQKQNMQRSRD